MKSKQRSAAGQHDGHALSVEQIIDAPPEAIFDAFIALYDSQRPEWVTGSQLDLRPGGRWSVAQRRRSPARSAAAAEWIRDLGESEATAAAVAKVIAGLSSPSSWPSGMPTFRLPTPLSSSASQVDPVKRGRRCSDQPVASL
jgi:hypothetical protein